MKSTVAIVLAGLLAVVTGCRSSAPSPEKVASHIAESLKSKQYAEAKAAYDNVPKSMKGAVDEILREGLVHGNDAYWLGVTYWGLATPDVVADTLRDGSDEAAAACVLYCPSQVWEWRRHFGIAAERMRQGHWNDDLARGLIARANGHYEPPDMSDNKVQVIGLLIQCLKQGHNLTVRLAAGFAFRWFDVESRLGRSEDVVALDGVAVAGKMTPEAFATWLESHAQELAIAGSRMAGWPGGTTMPTNFVFGPTGGTDMPAFMRDPSGAR